MRTTSLVCLVFLLLPTPAVDSAEKEASHIQIDCDYAGGNIVVDRVEGDDVYLHQDLRDTKGHWFYWNFRVSGAAGRALTIHFTNGNVIGVRGPALSSDGGKSWRWLGAEAVSGQTFRYKFGGGENAVRFCFAMPYLEADLKKFLVSHRDDPHLKVDVLCRTKKGRTVERLRLGRVDGQARQRALITCRHHACETMASHVVEGLMSAVLADTDEGRWLREHVELLVIPFMDKDGVEDGDQGKNRQPRDHNRDYSGESIHVEVKALREFVPKWSGGRLRFALDVHDPYIRGSSSEKIYFVENDGPTTQNVRRFAALLEASRRGSLPYKAADNLPFGKGWNTARNYTAGMSFSRWAGTQPGVRFAATVEVPYANAVGKPVTAESAREFGADLVRALRKFLDD